MFRTVPLYVIRSFSLYIQQCICHTACEQDQDGTQFCPVPDRKLSANLYDIYHCCVYSEKNSWWWSEKLSETSRVLFQKYIWESSASSSFYYKNYKPVNGIALCSSVHILALLSLVLLAFKKRKVKRRLQFLPRYLNLLTCLWSHCAVRSSAVTLLSICGPMDRL